MKRFVIGFGWLVAACVAVAGTGTSNEFRVDTRTGDRVSAGLEELTFSNLWDGDANATVTIRQDGAAIFEGLSGEGVKTWTVDRNGRYELTHTTYTNGVAGKVETAVFVVEGKEVPVSELTIDWGQKSFVYDGQPKEPVIAVKDGATTLTKDTHYLVEYKDNVNVGTAKAIVKGIEPYVGEVTNEFAITAAPIGPGGGEEPGSGEIPEGGLSKFDATYVYDGEGHTINTQALYAVTLVGSTPSFSFSLDGETGWQNDPFVYTNVGEYVIWYKITAPNYEDYKHQAKVTIQPLVLTVTFDANGGSCPMASKTVTHGATYGTLPTPTWTGHIFAGWYTAASGGDEVKDLTSVSIMTPQTLYAHWVSVTGVSAKQRYPWNGLVDIVVAFEGESNDVAKVDCSFIATNSATKAELSVASITRKGADSGKDNAWSWQFVWDAGTDAGAVKIDDVAFAVAAEIPWDGGVRLWENGPYWAECNVGATKPEEYGYYFWWGDTMGYEYNGSSWDAADGSKRGFLFGSDKCLTHNNSISQLKTKGYIDLTGNLSPNHDAATVWAGDLWRMPTRAEFDELIDNCDSQWVQKNGVYGRLVNGRGSFSTKSIFLPAVGDGGDWGLNAPGDYGSYWSSTPDSDDPNYAWYLRIKSDAFDQLHHRRWHGRCVRSVCGFTNGIAPVVTHLPLDCRKGDRVSAGTEELTFSNLWDGDAEATVTIAQDGAAIFTGLTGEGVKTWTVDRNGRYVLTHTTYTNGIKGKVETAVFVVEGKEVPVSELTIDWGQSSFVYDGQPKEPVITVKDGATTLAKDTHYLVEYKDNVNVGTAKAIVKGINPYVGEVTNTFTITKAAFPGGGEEPGDGTVPAGGVSKFDAVVMYDGEGHTIRTNDLVAAFKAAVGGDVAVEYACGGAGAPALPWMAVAPDFTNVCVTSVWYKVTSANYQDYVHEAKVTVTNRPVTLTSGTKLDFVYDGKPHAYTNLTVTAGSFVAGEGITTSNWATVTTVAEGEVDNAFDYEPLVGTKLSNYALTVVTGKIAVVSPDAVVVTITGHVASVVYDGLKKSVSGYDIVTISDPLYTSADFKFTGQSSTNGTNAGTYPMGLKSVGFVNTNPNFASVVFNVTDGKLVIAQAANAWTTEPAIDGWTYGETAKTPVGAAKFGAVAFAYDPMPVGAAGDYTMTATVAGTANYTGLSKTVPFTISKATLPGGGEEPGGGTVPEGGLSKFDTVVMYDGEGHTIRTNDLVAAFRNVIGNDFTVSYAVSESGGQGLPALPPTDAGAWLPVAPDFTNVCVTSVWYKVASANYLEFVHEAKVTVTNRPVTLTSGTKLDFVYDGKPHAYTNLTVTAGGFVAGEGIATSNWATVTTLAEGEVPNAFDFEAEGGTLLSNYALTVVTGRIAVVSPDAVVVTVTGHVSCVVYDGMRKSVSGYDVVSISDPLYTAADFKFTGQSATNGTNAGTYPMGLKSAGFVNTNPNFASVVFNVTDGRLVISQAANAWTVEPAIDGWTYDETAKTPVGAAKFGAMSFTYDPMPVGAAGDYTMTASVAGTANYTGLSKTVGFTIAKATLPGGGEEPGGGAIPEGGLSKFDAVAMYDGEGWTIKTNDLVAAFKSVIGNDFAVSYAVGESGGPGGPALPPTDAGAWLPVALDFTNACVTSVWYKVASANYLDFVHEAKVTVTNRPVTLTSGTKLDFTYDGKSHAYTNLTVTAGSFVAGEGIATSNWATVTAVAEGKVPNAFDFEAQKGTLLSNYDLTVVTGEIAVVSPDAVVVTVTGHVASVVYDGLKKSVSGYDIVSISDPFYTATDFKFTGQSATNGTNAGTYPMGLKSAGFANTNPNFASVVFNVTDGKLVISQAANVWTTEPAIEGWTYGETAKTPVGAAKFGAVSFAYDPMPVGAAGDYTMTATVAGTANYTGLSKTVGFMIAKATLPGGGEEPGGGTVPEGGVSKFDMVAMYDGEGHTIRTNDLVAAFKSVIGNDFTVSYAVGESGGQGLPALPPTDAGAWMPVASDFTNVCVTSVWYKVTSTNYRDFVHEARVTVTNRSVTLTSGTETFDYDGNAHSNMTVTISGEGFVAGEGVTTNNFATITEKGSKPNAFDYELILNPGSDAENYRVTCVTGTLTVVSVANAWLVEPTVTGKAYDGMPVAVTMGTPKFGTVSVTYDGGQVAAPVVAGNHTAKFAVAATADYGALEKVINYTIGKVVVDEPLIAAKTYNEQAQVADVAGSAYYTVVRNSGGTMAGRYAVVLKLVDAVNYRWASSGDETIILPFVITSDENVWTSGPTAPISVFGSGATFPVATAKYGDVEVRYSGTAVDGTVVENALQIVRPGTYTATFKARTTSSWSELTASVPLTVSAAGSVSAGALKALSAAPVSVSGVKSMSIPRTWFSKYQGFTTKFGNDLSKAALMKTGKMDGNGREMQVWQDYVAGTDPTKEDSRLSVKIEFRNGKPKISWTPNQNANEERVGNRVYTVWGKKDLTDKEWTPNVDETTGEWNFFKVTVDMPEQE